MFCGKCGAKVEDDAAFCDNCGNPLKAMDPTPVDPQRQREVNPQPSRMNGGSYVPPNRGVSPQPQPQGGAGLAIASMVLGIVALVLGCCFYYISIPCAIIGVILGAVSLKGNKAGRGMAIAGVVCSIISIVPAIIVIATGASLMSAAGLSGFGY